MCCLLLKSCRAGCPKTHVFARASQLLLKIVVFQVGSLPSIETLLTRRSMSILREPRCCCWGTDKADSVKILDDPSCYRGTVDFCGILMCIVVLYRTVQMYELLGWFGKLPFLP